MARIVADRVLETSTTTGTGSYTLDGAVLGYRAASAVCANGDTITYYAEATNVNGVANGDWEIGIGTWGTGGILARTTIVASSNSNAAVIWPAGVKRLGLGVISTPSFGNTTLTGYVDATPITAPTWVEGRVFYDTDAHTLNYYNDNNHMSVNIGQEQIVRVRNTTGFTIPDGSVVYVSGAAGQTPLIALAIATSSATSDIIGVTTTPMLNNEFGYVTVNGIVNGLNTVAFADGAVVYLSAITAGSYSTVSPDYPNYSVHVGVVLQSHAVHGKLLISPKLISTEASHVVGTLAVAQGGTGVTTSTGTGSVVKATSPSLITPDLGVAVATTLNKVTVTAPATGATLTLADGATLTASATASVSGTNTGDNAVNTLYSSLVTNATHTGDVTGSGTLTIASGAVTYAKIQNVSATSRVLGRITAAAGVVEELTGANLATIIGITNTAANVTSVNGATGAVTLTNLGLQNFTSGATVSGSNTGDNAVNTLYSGLVTNATHTGDVTGSGALTLASIIVAGGPTGSTSVVPVISWDAKGRLTVVTTATITPASIGAQAAGTYASGTGSASGTNTGDETLATIKSKLGISTLSGSNTGDQTLPTTLPASDVYAWAKAATKPAYTAAEVGAPSGSGTHSGSSSGTNTGDQTNISGNAATASSAATVNASNAQQNGDGWWRSSGATGWYSATYAVGIYATEAGNVRTYNGANFIAGGTVTGTNLSGTHTGSSSGTNTGDQTNISGNATTAGGLAVHTGVNSEVNKIVRTNASGYCDFGWINTVSGVATGTPARVYCSEDAYLRYYSMATFTGYVQAAATGSWGISVTGSSASTTGNAASVTVTTGRVDVASYPIVWQSGNSLYSCAATTIQSSTGTINATNFTATGSVSAATKSFLIPHPTKIGMKLRYGSLEGPENGVYIRGRLSGDTIELPEYWTKLVDANSITVSLTSIGKHQDLFVKEIADNKIIVGNQNLFGNKIDCFYVVYGERVDVDKLVVEF